MTPIVVVLIALLCVLVRFLFRSAFRYDPERARAALELARGAGARHIVVTGRPVPGVRGLLAALGYEGIAVCGQGAQVYDTASGRMLSALTLDRETAATALGKIEAETGALYAAVDQDGTDGHTLIEPGYRMAHPTLPARPVPHRDALWERPIAKVLVRHPELTDDELAATALELARRLAAGPTVALSAIKEAVAFGAGHTLEESLAKEDELQTRAGTSEDHVIAVRAFLAKEEPQYLGR